MDCLRARPHQRRCHGLPSLRRCSPGRCSSCRLPRSGQVPGGAGLEHIGVEPGDVLDGVADERRQVVGGSCIDVDAGIPFVDVQEELCCREVGSLVHAQSRAPHSSVALGPAEDNRELICQRRRRQRLHS
eukprot:284028-Rhodomonas_salina.1